MIKAFKEFWIDYFNVVKESNKWLKKHWKGYIVLCVIICSLYCIPYYIEYKKAKKAEKENIKSLHDFITNCKSVKLEDLEN